MCMADVVNIGAPVCRRHTSLQSVSSKRLNVALSRPWWLHRTRRQLDGHEPSSSSSLACHRGPYWARSCSWCTLPTLSTCTPTTYKFTVGVTQTTWRRSAVTSSAASNMLPAGWARTVFSWMPQRRNSHGSFNHVGAISFRQINLQLALFRWHQPPQYVTSASTCQWSCMLLGSCARASAFFDRFAASDNRFHGQHCRCSSPVSSCQNWTTATSFLPGTLPYSDTCYSDTVSVAESHQGTRFICFSEMPVNGNSMCNNHNSKSKFH